MTELGGSELAMWQLGRVASANFAAMGRIRGRFEVVRFRSALDDLARRHPRLVARIDPTPAPSFVPSDRSIPLDVLDATHEERWREVVQEQLDDAIDYEEGPLARVIVLRGKSWYDVVWIFHHSVADGRSGVLLFDQLMGLLGTTDVDEKDGIPQSMEVALRSELRGMVVFRAIRTLLSQLPWLLWRRPLQLVPRGEAPPADRTQGIVHRQLSPSQTEAVLERCRANGVRLTGYLQALMVQAIRSEIDKDGRVPLSCFTPVDLREHLPEPERSEVGLYVSFKTAFSMVAPESDVWALAKGLEGQVRSAKKRGEPLAMMWMQMKTINAKDDPESVRKKTEPFTQTSAGVTNVGRVGLEHHADLESIHFAGVSHTAGSCLCVAVSELRGTVFLNFFYSRPLVDDRTAERLANQVLERLGGE